MRREIARKIDISRDGDTNHKGLHLQCSQKNCVTELTDESELVRSANQISRKSHQLCFH